MTATIYREGSPVTGPLVMALREPDGFTTILRGFASKPEALAEARKRNAEII